MASLTSKRKADDVNFQGRRLNIAAAIKKQVCVLQPYNRSFEASSTSPPMPQNVYFHNGIPYTYHNGMAFFSSGNPPTNAITPVQPHPESVSMYQGTFGPPHGSTAAPSFGPTMMYHPCPNPPPPVYLPTQQYTYQPLPFDSYYQVASQSSGIMFSPGAGPASITSTNSAQNSSLVAVGDSGNSTQTLQLIPTQPGSVYATPHILHDIHYSSQSIYPITAVEGVTHHNEIQAIESPPSNLSAEDSSCSKTEPENAVCATPPTSKENEPPQTATTPVVSWLHCSESYECTKSVNDRQLNLNENSHDQSTGAAMYPVTMYNPVFSRPPSSRHPYPSAVNGYHENYSRTRNFVPFRYNAESSRRSSNPNVPKQQNVHNPSNNNNNYIVNDNYSVKNAESSNQTRNFTRFPRYQKNRSMAPTGPNMNRYSYPRPPFFPQFPFFFGQPHHFFIPPPQIAASRRFSGPGSRRQNINIPVYNSSNTNSSNEYSNSNVYNKPMSTTTTNNNNNNVTNNNNVGNNSGVVHKATKSVTTKIEPESGALCGAGDAPPTTHHSNVNVPGPTPIELCHQMQKLST